MINQSFSPDWDSTRGGPISFISFHFIDETVIKFVLDMKDYGFMILPIIKMIMTPGT